VAGGGGRSPFVVMLTASQRRWLKALTRRPTAQQRQVTRARIVLLASAGWANQAIARKLAIAPNTAGKWPKRFCQEGVDGLADRKRPGRPRVFPPAVVAYAKAVACELPWTRGLPLSRWSLGELRAELLASGLVSEVSTTTLWRWLAEDPIKPWQHHAWIFPRDPGFAAKAGVVLDLYQRVFTGCPLDAGEYVISADEKPSIQARCRCHPTSHQARRARCGWSTSTSGVGRWPTWPPGTSTRPACLAAARPRLGSSRLGAWSPRSCPVSGTRPPGGCSGWSTTARPTRPGIDPAAGRRVAKPPPGPPAHPRVMAQPSGNLLLGDPAQSALAQRLHRPWRGRAAAAGLQRRYEQTAVPFDWRYTKADLDRLLQRLDEHEHLGTAA
jgi:transposase